MKGSVRKLERDLTLEEINQNENILRDLITKAPRFIELTDLTLPRDSNQHPELSAAMLTLAEELDIDPVNVKLQKDAVVEILLTELSKRRISISPGVLDVTVIKLFHNFIRDLLTIHAYEKDARKLGSSSLAPHLKSYVQDNVSQIQASREKSIRDFFDTLFNMERITQVKVFGDGDCFYHAMMINIIYKVLNDEVAENSITAHRIKKFIFPLINTRLKQLGAPELDFLNRTLKQSILLLLASVPIKKSFFVESSPQHTDDDFEMEKIVKNCDFYHLLKDVCAPVTRAIMRDKLPEQKDTIHELLKENCFAYLIVNFNKELNFTDPSILFLARATLEAAEIKNENSELEQPILKRWKGLFKNQELKKLTEDDLKCQYLRKQIDSHWSKNQEVEYKEYFELHANMWVMASKPQQEALGSALNVNLSIISANTKKEIPLISHNENANATFLLEHKNSHFDVNIADANPTLAKAIQEGMECAMKKNRYATYQWKPPIVYGKDKFLTTTSIQRITTLTAPSTQKVQMLVQKHSAQNKDANQADILRAAGTGYKDFFASIQTGKLTKQMEEDAALAIELQNDEIATYYQRMK